MKKFTKLFLSCAAVAAVATAVGVSAMAADITGDVKGTFDETEKTVTINTETSGITPASGTQVTFLVFKGTADTNISADSVKGIDQGTTVQPTNNGLMSDVVAPPSGQDTYTVKVGYYNESNVFTVKSGTFKLGEALGETILIGDADSSGDVDADDSVAILKYNVGKFELDTAAKLAAADSDRSGDVDADDSVAILKYNVGKVSAANGNEYVGQEIEVDLSAYED